MKNPHNLRLLSAADSAKTQLRMAVRDMRPSQKQRFFKNLTGGNLGGIRPENHRFVLALAAVAMHDLLDGEILEEEYEDD